MNFGRPQWDKEFSEMVADHPGTDVGVFFCGPKGLSTVLHRVCNKHTSTGDRGTRFFYNKENF